LETIFNFKISKKLFFLRGTALRIIHGNNRFSDDHKFVDHTSDKVMLNKFDVFTEIFVTPS